MLSSKPYSGAGASKTVLMPQLACGNLVAALWLARLRGSWFGTGLILMGAKLHGYLVLQGNIHLRTSEIKHILKLLARKTTGLGTHWATYPFSRCRWVPGWQGRLSRHGQGNLAAPPAFCAGRARRQIFTSLLLLLLLLLLLVLLLSLVSLLLLVR